MERLCCALGWGQLGTTWRVQGEDYMEWCGNKEKVVSNSKNVSWEL